MLEVSQLLSSFSLKLILFLVHKTQLLKVAFCQKIRCASKKYSKSLTWAPGYLPSITVNKLYMCFFAQDSDLEYSKALRYTVFGQKPLRYTVFWFRKKMLCPFIILNIKLLNLWIHFFLTFKAQKGTTVLWHHIMLI